VGPLGEGGEHEKKEDAERQADESPSETPAIAGQASCLDGPVAFPRRPTDGARLRPPEGSLASLHSQGSKEALTKEGPFCSYVYT
jgi:hypothetical protein